jgi:rhodanese-related sulfurtransferase
MNHYKLAYLMTSFTLTAALSGSLVYADPAGNRYFRDRQYNSEISAAETYLDMMQNKVTVIDVRRLREYAAGHPERAYNVPYPHIESTNDQDAETFYWEVYNIVKGKTDMPLATLCRTGARSVAAGNILADPQNLAGDPSRGVVPGADPFTNVRNIWEGFVGQHKYAYAGGDIAHDENGEHIILDLSNQGIVSDYSDVYAHTTDANPNKDGWRNFQKLPWTTRILKPLSYLQDKKQYECWQTDEGCQ